MGKALVIERGEDGTPITDIFRQVGRRAATYVNWRVTDQCLIRRREFEYARSITATGLMSRRLTCWWSYIKRTAIRDKAIEV